MLGSLGAKAIEPIEMSVRLSPAGMKCAPASVDRHRPPVGLPIRTRFASAGETAMALTRPLVVPHLAKWLLAVDTGPIETQVNVSGLIPLLTGRAAQARSRAWSGRASNGYIR